MKNNGKNLTNQEIVTNHDLRKLFFRSFGLEATWNYEKMQATGFAFSIMPILKKLYHTKESMSKALKRHLGFFNTNPHASTFIIGLTASMKVQNATSKDFNEESINAVKVGLMGPWSGIFDSLFWGTIRVIATGIGTSLALKGNVLGPILFILLFNIPHLAFRYYATFLGYHAGAKFMQNISTNNIMAKVTFGASILGLMVVGGMTASMIPITTPLVLGVKGSAVKIQEVLDQILPTALPLGFTFLTYFLLKKGVKTQYLLLGLLVVGFIGSLLHIIQ